MRSRFFTFALLLSVGIVIYSFKTPKDWFIAGSHSESYDMGMDSTAGNNSKNAATIKAIVKKPKGFGTLMQMCASDKYVGKRLRMTGWAKCTKVKGWSAFWLRVDSHNGAIAFDNMFKRSLKGTLDWAKYEIVLDVPEGAERLAFGALLHGPGQIWFDDISFEVVDKTVPVTGESEEAKPELTEPTNLDFEK